MLIKRREDHLLAREKALAEGVKKVAAELRLVDLVDFITYIRTEQFANIEDIVNSSVELLFKPGTLTFGWGADLRVDWGEPPQIMLDMEFRHMSVTVFFGLALEAHHASVEIRYVSFEDAADDPEVNTRRLAEAIADARLSVPVVGSRL
ncbi:hypothetical protein SAMN05519103_08136 [Rhizobiales bacterium GAS113]|jgi:hypothetical protein|nr:hypothetical protein SAMN05519103_08136 [Rhizobiales bacterium GAS113]SED04162.1 hypothetical protein SAMN05519104_2657 [Rhizobiales bacterium GAS188]